MLEGDLGLSNSEENEVLFFKVLVVGQPAVGKTTLIKRYVHGVYNENYRSTIGVAHSGHTVIWRGESGTEKEITVKLQFWDLAGQDRISNTAKVYYRGAHGALCVCDVLREETRQQADGWKDMVHENATRQDGSLAHPPCVLVINKIDLYGKSPERTWLSPQISNLIGDNGFEIVSIDGKPAFLTQEFFESIVQVAQAGGYETGVPASAKLNVGIGLAINKLIGLMIKRYRQEDAELARSRSLASPTISLDRGEKPDDVLPRATLDENLYRSKQSGNRCGC